MLGDLHDDGTVRDPDSGQQFLQQQFEPVYCLSA